MEYDNFLKLNYLMTKRPWLLFALVTTVFWGAWGALIEIPGKAGFPVTLGYIVWSLTMIPCALVALAIVHWKLEYDWRSIGYGAIIGLTGAGGQLVLFHAVMEGPAYLIFPIISHGDEVLDMWVRMMNSKTFFRLTSELTQSQVAYGAPHLCFGQHEVDMTKPVILVEGGLDLLRLNSLGRWNVLASMGPISNTQLDSLYARQIYVAFDSDEAGKRMAERALKYLINVFPVVYYVDWSHVKAKDPGELKSVDQMEEVIRSAKAFATKLKRRNRLTKKSKHDKKKRMIWPIRTPI